MSGVPVPACGRWRGLFFSTTIAVMAVGSYYLLKPSGMRPDATVDLALIGQYCTDCHNAAEFAGGLNLAALEADSIAHDAATWEAVIRKLDAGMMPPAGEPRPSTARLRQLTAALIAEIDTAAQAAPVAGAPALHRLNRVEYGNAVRDLLALPIDPTLLLPADDSSEGFDNIANALSISPAHIQGYVSAAAKISRLAVGDPTTSPALASYSAAGDTDHRFHVEGLPYGTRSGVRATHVFPLDAEYEFTVRRAGGSIFTDSVGGDEDVEVLLDGERLQVIPAGAPARFRVPVPAGPHEVSVAVIESSRPFGVDDIYANLAQITGVGGLTIMGPFMATGAGDTPSRRAIFSCRPRAAAGEEACAREILARLASRAYRRAVAEDGVALEPLLAAYEEGRQIRGFEAGIQYALARVLADPQFLFRFEDEPPGLAAGTVYPVTDTALASRLSFFLWSSIPDAELLQLAAAGRLSEPAVLDAQARRMLADPRADALVSNFAGQWLGLRQLASVNPATREFDGNLRDAFARETALLFTTILREDRPITDLLDADFTFVNERLAEHYGIPNIRGSHFRRVSLTDESRRGLLGHGSLLTITSAPNRTSPVIRGAWILENLLGTPAPLPPPGVETNLEPETAPDSLPPSVRARLERHRADPSCAACHSLIDPLGFALEHFDEIGAWRDRDGREPIDASGVLWDGTPLDGVAALRAALLERREGFAGVVTEKLLTYALGRAVEYHDMPAVREIVARASEADFRFSAFILGIVNSTPFRMKTYSGTEDGPPGGE